MEEDINRVQALKLTFQASPHKPKFTGRDLPFRMVHECALESDAGVNVSRWHEKFLLISPDNPMRLGYFRSNVSIRNEQSRQLRVNKYAIHPFSKFKAWYDMYLIYLYISLMITKPVDTAFLNISDPRMMYEYRWYTIITDVLSWVDIFLNFNIGVEVEERKTIELRRGKIAKHYICGPYFLFDVLSSVPKLSVYLIPEVWPGYRAVVGLVGLMSLLKFVRIVSLLGCIRRTAEYIRASSKGLLFLLCSVIVSVLVVHWMACLQFAISKFVRRSFSREIQNTSWFFDDKGAGALYRQRFHKQYIHSLFKSSAYMLGIRINIYKMTLPEEYLMATFTYLIGKILISFIWIILAVAILNSRLMDIKFLEVMNQVEEYMKKKQLPIKLREKITQFFNFKYGRKFFKEQLITGLLSEKLRTEASLHICKSLVKNVSLFSELSPLEISKVVDYLIPEIFLPNSTIVHAGSPGDAMYFLSSGTVAVYTRSGREICHMQDGAYFGEISLVLKGHPRLATVVTLETSQVYKLHKKDLERCLLANKKVKWKIIKEAEARFREATKLEEEYKEKLYEESFLKSTTVPKT